MTFKIAMPAVLAVLAMASCQVDEIPVPADELYTREFIKQFGVSDPSQDWNLATSVTATVDPSTIPGASTIYIYDRMPGADGCQLAAQFSAKTGTLNFDFAKPNTRAYVQVIDEKGCAVVSSYLPITDGTLRVTTATPSRAGETTPNVQLVNFSTDENGNYGKGIGDFEASDTVWNAQEFSSKKLNNRLKFLDVFPIYGFKVGNGIYSNRTDADIYQGSYLKGSFTTIDDGRSLSDLVRVVGKDGVFHEGLDDNNKCNLSKYSGSNAPEGKNLHPEEGVIYEAPNGEVTLEYAYGAAAFHNSFGYFYYKDGFTHEDILKAPKFLLMLDASPWTNTQRLSQNSDTKYDDWRSYQRYPEYKGDTPTGWDDEKFKNYGGLLPADDIRAWEAHKAVKDFRYKPSFHKLLYYPIKADKTFDLDHPTYKFEKGVKIGFFILCHGYQKISRCGNSGNVLQTEFRFSIPWMNKAFGNTFKGNHSNSSFIKDSDPLMSFVNYRLNNVSVMGVEDGTLGDSDHDMNDILFMVHGVEDDSPNFETYPFAQSWIIACEDLGSTYDFDFNDMVFGVSYVAKDKGDRKVYIKALAAGGTLPIELWRKGKNGDAKIFSSNENGSDEHWNQWFGENDHTVVINAGGYNDTGKEVEITLAEDEEFSLSTSMFHKDEETTPMGGFMLNVISDKAHTQWVKPVGTTGEYDIAPQMILLPVTWKWPTERTPIFEAYPGGVSGNGDPIPSFSQWCKTTDYTGWNEMLPVDDKVVNHNWQGHKLE